MTTQEVLKQCSVDGLIVRLPEIKLDRKEYLDVAQKLELIGGKWKGGKTKGFVFEEDPTELLNQVAEGEQRNIKKEYQFFPTPKDVASMMVTMCFPFIIEGDVKILEPSAGDGALIKAFREQHGEHFQVDCFELMGINRTKLIKLDNVKIVSDDFIDCALNGRVNNKYDYIIANPPFTKNQDIDHVLCMYKACKPGGIIVTLTSTSWQRGSQKKQEAFKEWLTYLGAGITEIPAGAFAESGTNVETLMITIRKRKEEQTDLPDLTKYIKPTQSNNTETFIPTESTENLKQQFYDNGFCQKVSTMKKHNDVDEKTPEQLSTEIIEKLEGAITSFKKVNQILSPNNNNDMDFFQQLSALGNVDLNIRIMQKNDKLTLSISPGNASNITPILVTGTAAELDAEFLNSIAPQVQSISGIVTNIHDVKVEAEKLEAEAKKPKEKPKAETKKTEPKKAEKVKVTEPALFGDDNNENDDDSNDDDDDDLTNENE